MNPGRLEFSVRRGFPALYDFAMRIAERGHLGEWRREVVRPADGDVLEIAAGTGLDFPHYRAGVRVVATEPDQRMIERARDRAERSAATIILVAADAQALPFRDGTFDTVVVGLGLCTIPSPRRALAELRRVLRPGGVARLLEHVRVERPVVGWLQDLFTPLWRRLAGGCRLNARSVETVRCAGFRIDNLRSYMGGYVVTIEASTPAGSPPGGTGAAPVVGDMSSQGPFSRPSDERHSLVNGVRR